LKRLRSIITYISNDETTTTQWYGARSHRGSESEKNRSLAHLQKHTDFTLARCRQLFDEGDFPKHYFSDKILEGVGGVLHGLEGEGKCYAVSCLNQRFSVPVAEAAAASLLRVAKDRDVFERCKVVFPLQPSDADVAEVHRLFDPHLAKVSACTSAVFKACRENGWHFQQANLSYADILAVTMRLTGCRLLDKFKFTSYATDTMEDVMNLPVPGPLPGGLTAAQLPAAASNGTYLD
jgi:hypothetical protein